MVKQILFLIFLGVCLVANASAQTETLSNKEIILMTSAGLSKELILLKIKNSNGRYDTSVQGLIELQKAGVVDEVIKLLADETARKTLVENSVAADARTAESAVEHRADQSNASNAPVVFNPKFALRAAKTIAIEKSTLNPSRQALEKELLKRPEWRRLNLSVVRYKENADLYVEIGFVPLSVITHRYTFSVYDRQSGTVVAAGETTSWGSLASNLAREISKKLDKIL